mgnify:CR=1 FL=1
MQQYNMKRPPDEADRNRPRLRIMCGRFAITTPPKAMKELFGFGEQPNFPARYNIAPTQPVPVVAMERGERHFRLMRWGLIPSWAKEAPKSLLINARADTIDEKPSFRGAFRHGRCLMPADAFYEWKAKGGGPKQPFLIRRRDGGSFAMAAIASNWMGADGSEVDTCAVVTTDANETLMPIHHRMPVILDERDWEMWLDPETQARDAQKLLRPAPDDLMEAVPIGTRINRVANDDPSLWDRHEVGDEPPVQPAPKAKEKPANANQMDLF